MRHHNSHMDARRQLKMGGFVGAVFGVVFFSIGILVMVGVWGGYDGFHQPPLFFRIFATLIAVPFVAMGGAIAYGSIRALANKGDAATIPSRSTDDGQRANGQQADYNCPGCGAPLARGADVSPHGDVRCSHCGNWFNVHKTSQN